MKQAHHIQEKMFYINKIRDNLDKKTTMQKIFEKG